MKTTALFFLSFFLVLPGSMNLVNSGQSTESEFNYYSLANYSPEFSNESPEKQNSAITGIPSLNLNKSTIKSSNAEILVFSENELNIENWMTEINNFNKETSVFSGDEIQIEDWMTNSFILNSESMILIEQDPNLEDWMSEPESWKDNSTVISEIPEMDLDENFAIEKWMTEPGNWVNNN